MGRSLCVCPRCRRDERLDLQWSLEGHQLGVVSVDISHTLPIAASSSLDAHIRLWDLENGKQIKSMDAGPGESSGCGSLVTQTFWFKSKFLNLDLTFSCPPAPLSA